MALGGGGGKSVARKAGRRLVGGVLERLSGRMRVMEWLGVMGGLSGWAMAVGMMGGWVEACVVVLVVVVVVWVTLGMAVRGVAWRWCGWNL